MAHREEYHRLKGQPDAARTHAQREEHEQIAQLRHRGIGDEQFQTRLPQCLHRTVKDRRRAKHPQKRAGRFYADGTRKDPQPHAQRNVKRRLDHQRGKQRAHGRRRVGMRRRQPEMQRKHRGFQHQPGGHQTERDGRAGAALQVKPQRDPVEVAAVVVDHRHAQQVEQRRRERREQVAQRRRISRRRARQRNEAHRQQAEQFQRHVHVEDVGRHEKIVQPGPRQQKQRPETARPRPAPEVRPRIKGNAGHQPRRHAQHHQAGAVHVQVDAQRYAPAAQRITERPVRRQVLIQRRKRSRYPGEDHAEQRPQVTRRQQKRRQPGAQRQKNHQDGKMLNGHGHPPVLREAARARAAALRRPIPRCFPAASCCRWPRNTGAARQAQAPSN